ncbi:hypothetical protein BKA62DRAFT_412249 [Auriculariales sp. MPI-PUGE-AT-0066]|nr:hypothetical protein BKA62DRAFT_412249 [Auriculariales sp. MPI-PUGE-AT-0066]
MGSGPNLGRMMWLVLTVWVPKLRLKHTSHACDAGTAHTSPVMVNQKRRKSPRVVASRETGESGRTGCRLGLNLRRESWQRCCLRVGVSSAALKEARRAQQQQQQRFGNGAGGVK